MIAPSRSLGELTVADVGTMNYNELIGVVRETNRPPGGNASILDIVVNAHVTARSRVLDIGTSTGVTALEIARLTGANVVGIDINEVSLGEARARAERLALTNVSFVAADACALPFEDASFDLVFCGNVTSLVEEKHGALAEYRRVVRQNGTIAAIPMYYRTLPSDALISAVRRAVGVALPVLERDEAIAQFEPLGLDVFYRSHWAFDDIPQPRIDRFCDRILDRPHIASLPEPVRTAVAERYRSFMSLFRANLALMGYSILLFRTSSIADDPELFTGTRLLG